MGNVKLLRSSRARLSLYETNTSGRRVHATMKFCSSQFMDANNALYEWYLLACSNNIFSRGPQLIEKAKDVAERLGVVNLMVLEAGWINGST